MLNLMQECMVRVLLGPEDPTAWKRYQRAEWARIWQKNHRKRITDTARRWRKRNPEKVRAATRAWLIKNPEKVRAAIRVRYKKNLEKLQAAARERYKKNPEKYRAFARNWSKCRRNTDPAFKLLTNMRTRINRALKTNTKGAGTCELIGCTIPELRGHLEALFVPGMTWLNQGFAWHVDHIRPCASFDFSDPAQQRECFHYSNLQPLWAGDNRSKSDKWSGV